ncbi:lysozyme [Sphingobacterium mizutaii]|uniref:lysozyme n=1 Tax=Sphingobacterium mizutaii TaxID=1010 RepID=UPI0016273D73|nr:lysozyme [Sphingobacterium mizutaii]
MEVCVGINIIKKHVNRRKRIGINQELEGFYPKPYRDPIGIPTIGYGFMYYLPDRRKATMQDRPLTEYQATCMLQEILKGYENDVLRLVKVPLTQNQFDAFVSLTFNLGATNLGKSTLLRKLNVNPNDPSIRDEFAKWNKAG